MNDFKFMEQVVTPKGTGSFIARLTDGTRCQVALWVGSVPKNLIFDLDQVARLTDAKQIHHPRSRPEPVSTVEDQALQEGGTACTTP